MATIYLPVGSLIYLNSTIKLSEHNRQPASIQHNRIEKTQRMANGTLRKFFVADKKSINVSWNILPSFSTFTVDGGYGAMDIKSFYDGFAAKASGALSGTSNFDVTLRYSSPSNITNVSGDGTTITYTAANNFSTGDKVTIYGVNPSAYNLSNATIASASSSQFTITNAATGSFVSGGQAFKTETFNMIFTSCSFELVKRNVKEVSGDTAQEFWNVSLSMDEV
jgi:hypothetical protein